MFTTKSTPTPSASSTTTSTTGSFDYPTLLHATEQFVKTELSKNDGSHDWHHISRVRANVLSLATDEGVTDPSDRELVELAALLHDIADWKYSGSETQGIEMARAFLLQHLVPEEKVTRICHMIEMVGFKSELGRIEAAKSSGATSTSSSATSNDAVLLGLVQDADRLDAIGAIGIARCFTFGGSKGRAMFDPEHPFRADLTMAEYKATASVNSPSINHFYEKLLKLKDLMKTRAGKLRAEKRHQYMVEFLKQFDDEWNGRA